MAKTVDIPYNFTQRDYQIPFWLAIQDEPVKRAVTVWHRRSGKDKTMLNAVLIQMLRRVGVYYYVFPEFNQGRKALWDNIDSQGFKTMNHIPVEIRKRTDQQQMHIEIANGSILQVIGASDIDRIVGTNPVGIIFSEYSLMSPAVIGYLLPIVNENNGFMWFNFTPRGDNHARTLWEQAQRNPDWFSQMVTVADSKVFNEAELKEIRDEYIALYGDDKLYNQEMLCSFEEAVQGSYYGDMLKQAEIQGRIGKSVPYRPENPVHTYWDLGIGDATAIWFAQFDGSKVNLIDYMEATNKGLDYYVKELQNKPYVYGDHYAPHDIKIREYGSGLSRIETARGLGINFKITPKLSIEDGINAARILLARSYFDDNEAVRLGLATLKNYHRKYNEETRVYDNKPLHDWSSNGADAFRYLAVAAKKQGVEVSAPQDDIPKYAVTGTVDYAEPRRNPFESDSARIEREEAANFSLTTDAFNEEGWVR
jgi:phage terminase large subunit